MTPQERGTTNHAGIDIRNPPNRRQTKPERHPFVTIRTRQHTQPVSINVTVQAGTTASTLTMTTIGPSPAARLVRMSGLNHHRIQRPISPLSIRENSSASSARRKMNSEDRHPDSDSVTCFAPQLHAKHVFEEYDIRAFVSAEPVCGDVSFHAIAVQAQFELPLQVAAPEQPPRRGVGFSCHDSDSPFLLIPTEPAHGADRTF